jgi:hypothetical protein
MPARITVIDSSPSASSLDLHPAICKTALSPRYAYQCWKQYSMNRFSKFGNRDSRIGFAEYFLRLTLVDVILHWSHSFCSNLIFHNQLLELQCESQFYQAGDQRCVFDIWLPSQARKHKVSRGHLTSRWGRVTHNRPCFSRSVTGKKKTLRIFHRMDNIYTSNACLSKVKLIS